MNEIEIKGRVHDVAAVRAALDAEATFVGTSLKRDLYYGPERKRAEAIDLETDAVFRLREVEGIWLVTAKTREIEDDVEINREAEFTIQDVASFRQFAQAIGFRPFIVKRKKTREYTFGRATVELCRIDPIGDFLEVEILLELGATEEDIEEAAEEVRSFLAFFGVPDEHIESRPYIDLLRRVGTGRC